jgi:hypothetical protein
LCTCFFVPIHAFVIILYMLSDLNVHVFFCFNLPVHACHHVSYFCLYHSILVNWLSYAFFLILILFNSSSISNFTATFLKEILYP